MLARDVVQFVAGTSEPAFAVDGLGCITAWNHAAEQVLDASAAEVVGRPCSEVICGTDESGAICSRDCVVMRSAKDRRSMGNFDLRIDTPKGVKWFNVTPIIVDVNGFTQPFTIQIMRQIDIYKRLEMLLRDFILSKANIPPEQITAMLSSETTIIRDAGLTKRELEILQMVEHGGTSVTIGEKLNISTSTVDNHMQHILKKLSAHSRLEAVLRAEHSGLL